MSRDDTQQKVDDLYDAITERLNSSVPMSEVDRKLWVALRATLSRSDAETAGEREARLVHVRAEFKAKLEQQRLERERQERLGHAAETDEERTKRLAAEQEELAKLEAAPDTKRKAATPDTP